MTPPRGPAPTPRNLFSFSRLKAFDQCPLRYRFRYLKGLKEAFRSIESHVGNAVHDVLEWLYEERAGGSEPALDRALDRLAEAWDARWEDGRVAVIRVADDAGAYLRHGREMVASFHERVFSNDRSVTVALEERLSVRLSERVVFTGFADRIGRTEQGTLFVVDYKTSAREGNGDDFSEGLQAPLYAAAVLERHGEEPVCLAGYHYLRHGSTSWRRVDRDEAGRVQARFLAKAERALDATEFPARPGILCAWCGFNHICERARVPDELSGGLRLAREREGS